MSRSEEAARRILRLQAAVGVVLCPVVGIGLIIFGIARASSGTGNPGSILGITLIVGIVLIFGTFICLRRYRQLGK
ncbi:hypothetical protein [Curtobacterium sp. MCPF17_003]|uniref:hypothetical protein n=1 Tax=Curtobacterium sp. MCPF17_003 TaxID=2175637 RepID=UPI0011B707DD|nr:hypothetical protein [Curtobacterium sp. MCPF17_003]